MEYLESHIHCWTADSQGLIQKRDNLLEAIKYGDHGYYALCDYSFSEKGVHSNYGNLWGVGFCVRGLLLSILPETDASCSDDDLVRKFQDEFCFAYWKLIPTTETVFNDYKVRRKTDGVPSYTIDKFNISVIIR